MTAYNLATEDDKSRQIKPVLFNTEKDGSGTWYFAVVTPDGKLISVRGDNGLLSSGILQADALVKSGAALLFWLTVTDTAALSLELNDSLNNSGSDVWGISLPANGYAHFIFDPPLEFATGIYLDVSTATCKVTLGYQ